ncbi:MAG: amidohydrolase [Pirellulales bacterium]
MSDISSNSLTPTEKMCRIDAHLSHVWMVRTFLKHSDEAIEEDELRSIQRTLYDVMLAMGPTWKAQDPEAYLRQIRKKLSKLRAASEQFIQLQPEISTHTNFQMAAQSLRQAILEIETTIQTVTDQGLAHE